MRGLFPVIIGPTASGKSTLAVDLAIHLRDRHGMPAEIVTADSIQVYRGLDIGSAKPTPEERRGVPHHLIDIVEPTEAFSVDAWLGMAQKCIGELRGRGVLPIVVGGTHLYIKALLDGLFDGPEPDAALRAELHALDPAERRRRLEAADPAAAARIHPNDARRTVRALEVFQLTGRPISAHQGQWDRPDGGRRTDCFLALLNWPTEVLNRRINARVKQMMELGLFEEARGLAAGGRLGIQAREALGYKQLLAHLEGRGSLDEAVERVKVETRRFAKNQRTWIRRLQASPLQGGVLAVDASSTAASDVVQSIVDKVLTTNIR